MLLKINLVEDPEHIAQHDEAHEDGALAFRHLRLQRLVDGDRPADGEAEKEKDFENLHLELGMWNYELRMQN